MLRELTRDELGQVAGGTHGHALASVIEQVNISDVEIGNGNRVYHRGVAGAAVGSGDTIYVGQSNSIRG